MHQSVIKKQDLGGQRGTVKVNGVTQECTCTTISLPMQGLPSLVRVLSPLSSGDWSMQRGTKA